jgi:hypothetical protein
MPIHSITTLTAMVSWTLVRGAGRLLISLAEGMFVVLAWIALGFVGGAMLLRWAISAPRLVPAGRRARTRSR